VNKQQRAEAEIANESSLATGLISLPSFRVVPNPQSSTRGHKEQGLAKSVVCQSCHARKPKRGGWSHPCPGDTRKFWG
jgi:hypothetical protein